MNVIFLTFLALPCFIYSSSLERQFSIETEMGSKKINIGNSGRIKPAWSTPPSDKNFDFRKHIIEEPDTKSRRIKFISHSDKDIIIKINNEKKIENNRKKEQNKLLNKKKNKTFLMKKKK